MESSGKYYANDSKSPQSVYEKGYEGEISVFESPVLSEEEKIVLNKIMSYQEGIRHKYDNGVTYGIRMEQGELPYIETKKVERMEDKKEMGEMIINVSENTYKKWYYLMRKEDYENIKDLLESYRETIKVMNGTKNMTKDGIPKMNRLLKHIELNEINETNEGINSESCVSCKIVRLPCELLYMIGLYPRMIKEQNHRVLTNEGMKAGKKGVSIILKYLIDVDKHITGEIMIMYRRSILLPKKEELKDELNKVSLEEKMEMIRLLMEM